MPRRQADLNQKSVCRKNQNRGRPDSRIANAWFAEHDPEGVAFLWRKAMKVLAAILIFLVSSAAAAQECKSCSEADACIQTYLKAASEAQRATKVATRDWQQNLDKKTSAEFSSRGMAALQNVMVSQVRAEIDRLKECLAKIK
jgi:flagellar basal body L-ring protein FlgH